MIIGACMFVYFFVNNLMATILHQSAPNFTILFYYTFTFYYTFIFYYTLF